MAGNMNSGRPRKDDRKVKVNFRVQESVLDKIGELSIKFNISESEIIKLAVEAYMEVVRFVEKGMCES